MSYKSPYLIAPANQPVVEVPIWEPAGPLHYNLSLMEIEKILTKKFLSMAQSGHLISQKIFQYWNRENFYPQEGFGIQNLTRIWGADYINSHLSHTKFKAVEHFLVLDEGESDIEIQLEIEPYLSPAHLLNGQIFTRFIEGKPVADKLHHSELERIGYTDFTDPGNVIKDKNKIYWVIDTELNSFTPPQGEKAFY